MQVPKTASVCWFSAEHSGNVAEGIRDFAVFQQYLFLKFFVMYPTLPLSSILQPNPGVYYAEHFQMAVYRPVRGDRLADHRLYSGVFQALQKKITPAKVKRGTSEEMLSRLAPRGIGQTSRRISAGRSVCCIFHNSTL